MDEQSRRVLEYDEVLSLVNKYIHWEPGAEQLRQFMPLQDLHDLQERQRLVVQASTLYDQAVGIGAGGLEDCREAIKTSALGRVLSPTDLLHIGDLAIASRKTGQYLRQNAERFPDLAELALRLGSFSELENAIRKCISTDGNVLDSASSHLRTMRSELGVMQSRLSDHVSRILRSNNLGKMLQEPIVTIRSGRTVVPVKSEYRSQFPGLVIDQSASGATLYMEPWAVVEMGNRLRSLTLAIQKEIEAILSRLSGQVGQHAASLEISAEELARFDAIMAVAAYGRSFGGVVPEISEKRVMHLVDARHPLLVKKLGEAAVPMSLDLNDDLRIVVVTGPNTGGKTVVLKTVGLLVALALTGIPIPAKAGTIVPFMKEIWADIGDEQSLSQSLSTFSAHLGQILRIIPHAGPDTLVLLDELGAGTDPSEGGALGMALLEHFLHTQCRVVVTAHLAELKVFASKTEGISNAAMEFNGETLMPTFRLVMGVPGRSNALRVAHRLGLPDSIERRAREHLGQHHVEVEGLLDELEQERSAAERWGNKLHSELSEVEQVRQQYEQRLSKLERQRQSIMDQARSEADSFVEESRSKVHAMLRRVRDHLANLDRVRRKSVLDCQNAARELSKTIINSEDLDVFAELSPVASEVLAAALKDAARRRFPQTAVSETLEMSEESSQPSSALDQAFIEQAGDFEPFDSLEADSESSEEEQLIPHVSETVVLGAGKNRDSLDRNARDSVRIVECELNALKQQARDLAPEVEEPLDSAPEAAIQVGSNVYVHKYGQEGTVLSLDGKRAEVQLGVIRIKVERNEMELVKPKPGIYYGKMPESRKAQLSRRIDLHGKTVDEALHELGYRLDEAFMSNMEMLEIIHGKGTFTLRRAVIEYVKQHPMVAEYRCGDAHEGGIGVTIVRLK